MKKMMLGLILVLGIIAAHSQTHTVVLIGKGIYNDSLKRWEKIEKMDSIRILAVLDPARLLFLSPIPGDFIIGPIVKTAKDSTMATYIYAGFDKVKHIPCTLSLTTTTKFSEYIAFTVYYEKDYIMFLLLPYTQPNKKL